MSVEHSINGDAAVRFLDTLFAPYEDGVIEFRSLGSAGPARLWIPLSEWRGGKEAAAARLEGWMERETKAERDCYVGVLPRKQEVAKASGKTNILAAAWAWGECDYKDHSPDRALALVNNLQPAIVVASGGGLHAYARLGGVIVLDAAALVKFEKAMKRYQAALMSDAISDAPRIMRLPGSRNWKPGRDGVLVELLACEPPQASPVAPEKRSEAIRQAAKVMAPPSLRRFDAGTRVRVNGKKQTYYGAVDGSTRAGTVWVRADAGFIYAEWFGNVEAA